MLANTAHFIIYTRPQLKGVTPTAQVTAKAHNQTILAILINTVNAYPQQYNLELHCHSIFVLGGLFCGQDRE